MHDLKYFAECYLRAARRYSLLLQELARATESVEAQSAILSGLRGEMSQFVDPGTSSVMQSIPDGKQAVALVIRHKPGHDKPDVEIYGHDGKRVL